MINLNDEINPALIATSTACLKSYVRGISYGINRLETVQACVNSKNSKKDIRLWIDNLIKKEKEDLINIHF